MKTSRYPAAIRLRPNVGALLGCLAAFMVQLPPVWAQANPAAVQTDTQKAEVALALSACPPAVAKRAAVYVLSQSGYIKVRDSQNGFTALVQHTVPAAQEPRCMGAEGTRTWLPRILKVAELCAEGKSREEAQQIIADGSSTVLVEAVEGGWWYAAPLIDGRCVCMLVTDAAGLGGGRMHAL